jgi:hypothetical protein
MGGAVYHVPGVYSEPQPRTPEPFVVRTDVAGFVGFEPRVRNGTTAAALLWDLPGPPAPPSGHAFRVDVSGFQLVLGSVRGRVPATTDFVLSQDTAAIPIADGESIVYALAAGELRGTFRLVAAAGGPAASGGEVAPTPSALAAAVAAALGPGRPSLRLVDVTVRRVGDAVRLTVHPTRGATLSEDGRDRTLSLTRCDDWRDFLLSFGEPPDDGTLLGPAVQAFFANGGRRCYVATVRRPDFEDAPELARALDDMVGVARSSTLEATGLERLLLVPDVTFVDVPDLYASRVDRTVRTIPLPPSEREACFLPCDRVPPKGVAVSVDRFPTARPIFESSPLYDGGASTNAVFETQKRLVRRVADERWRALLLLSVPRLPDGGSGPYVPPTDRDAAAWLHQFDLSVKQDGFADTDEMSCAALYWPWLLEQFTVDGPVFERPPSPHAAGIVARRDLARGPEVSPANETLRAVVGLSAAFGDDVHGALYDPAPDAGGRPVPAVNVVRSFAGYGIQLWGARTLSTDRLLRFVSVRRTLTAIELRMKASLDLLVFEPNTPLLWLQVTQVAFSVLMPLFESGALAGLRPEEAFYVRCDGSVNSAESIAEGRLYVEVGVAVVAPAEFIVFRVGRREGVIEVLE